MPSLLSPIRFISLILLGLLLAAPVHGEVFKLRDGGRVVGRLLNPDRAAREDYSIELYSGGQITLAEDEVVKCIPLRSHEEEYEKHRAEAPDTIDGNWKLASWCLAKHLTAQRDVHLRRIIELEPNHERAWRALGYSRIDDRWQIRKEVMESRGLKWYRGRYRTKQEIDISERAEKEQKTRNQWRGKLKRYSGWLSGHKYEQGKQAILAIDDPLAVGALNKYLIEDGRSGAQNLYIQALAGINTPDAIKALCLCAIHDNDEEVRLSCLDHLKKEKRPGTVAYFIRMLRDNDNAIINRAAVALAYMNDTSAIRSLIDVLVTVHKHTITIGKQGGMGATFGNGSTGLSAGTRRETRTVTKRNQAVLDALVTLTRGVNFGFDDRAWRHWHAKKHKREALDARRN